ncbi:hypothetical protein MPSI1_002473 [Malassezia psittaci]|uniref:Uncharacterized protein n=1 Tax=Malassezia psittaci TaxID=1821823 RepID=A0AAF0FFP0_9BASI|nr:hypothetical protein MPSI1_002473 [Malassezia psittaci]
MDVTVSSGTAQSDQDISVEFPKESSESGLRSLFSRRKGDSNRKNRWSRLFGNDSPKANRVRQSSDSRISSDSAPELNRSKPDVKDAKPRPVSTVQPAKVTFTRSKDPKRTSFAKQDSVASSEAPVQSGPETQAAPPLQVSDLSSSPRPLAAVVSQTPESPKNSVHETESAPKNPEPANASSLVDTSETESSDIDTTSRAGLKEAFALRLKLIAYLRRVVQGQERFLYSALLRPTDFSIAVAQYALQDWCIYAERSRSILALALQDTTIKAVLNRVSELDRDQPTGWYMAVDVRPARPSRDEEDYLREPLDVVKSLSALLAVLCALYAKFLACVDTEFHDRVKQDSSTNVTITTAYGPVTVQSLLEPFQETQMLVDSNLDILTATHHLLSVSLDILTQEFVHGIAKNLTYVSRYASKTEIREWDALLASGRFDWDHLVVNYQDHQDRPPEKSRRSSLPPQSYADMIQASPNPRRSSFSLFSSNITGKASSLFNSRFSRSRDSGPAEPGHETKIRNQF